MTNREEIAKKLREVNKDDDSLFMDSFTAVYKLSDIIGARGKTYEFFFKRLADLIDPTRKLKIQDGHACCGNCGHRLAGEHEEEEGYWCFRPYCPDCGARVVRDHDDA